MRISIASDHAGFEQKQALALYQKESGHEVSDRGPADDGRVDYPDFAALVADDVAAGVADFGVLVCGTGIGMAVAAALAREHNDANVVTLSGRFVELEENERILDVFLSTEFGGGRHAGRVEKIMALETR